MQGRCWWLTTGAPGGVAAAQQARGPHPSPRRTAAGLRVRHLMSRPARVRGGSHAPPAPADTSSQIPTARSYHEALLVSPLEAVAPPSLTTFIAAKKEAFLAKRIFKTSCGSCNSPHNHIPTSSPTMNESTSTTKDPTGGSLFGLPPFPLLLWCCNFGDAALCLLAASKAA